MDFDKIVKLFNTFLTFIQTLRRNVGVIDEDNADKAAGYKGDIDNLINAIKGALDK